MQLLSIVLLSLCLTACAGTVSKTTQLRPGMSTQEVTSIMGNPGTAQFLAGHLVWRYSLSQVGKGMVPYYLVFNPQTNQLVSWFENQAEYEYQQAQWLNAFKAYQSTQPQTIDLNIRHTP